MLFKHIAPGRSFYSDKYSNLGYVKLAYDTRLVERVENNRVIAKHCQKDESHSLVMNAVRIDDGKLFHFCHDDSVNPM